MAVLYTADRLSHPSQPDPPLDWGDTWRVTSAPTSTLGRDGDLAVNINTRAFYIRGNGIWALQTGGSGSGSIQVIADSFADPNGNVTPDDPSMGAVYCQDGADLTVFWRWDVTAQVWRQLLG